MCRNLWNLSSYGTNRFGKDSINHFWKKIYFFPFDTTNIEVSHRLKSDDNGQNNKVIVKFRKREDMVRAVNQNSPSKMLP